LLGEGGQRKCGEAGEQQGNDGSGVWHRHFLVRQKRAAAG